MRPLLPLPEPQKSFSKQETFATDWIDEEYIEATLLRMADGLFADVRDENRSVRTLTVRVRYNDMGEDQVSKIHPTKSIVYLTASKTASSGVIKE